MKITNYYRIKQLAQKRLVWILLFSVFQLYSTISLVHTQKHTLVHDHQCRICLTNFNHTPFLLTNNFTFIPEIQTSFIVKKTFTRLLTLTYLSIGNRGPPNN